MKQIGPCWPRARHQGRVRRFKAITDKGVAVGGAFDSGTATVMTPITHCVASVLASWRS